MNWKILTVAGGFYYFGNEVQAQEGFIGLDKSALFGGFAGAKGMPGVARGAKDATVILDQFEQDTVTLFPITAVYSIASSVNLYTFKGTTLR
ncbi:MAG: hypothetical protein SH817_09920 [Leptospira sp.]|nr:hypothetical protein [Leptospira sp.]